MLWLLFPIRAAGQSPDTFRVHAEKSREGTLHLNWSPLGTGYIYAVESSDKLSGRWSSVPYTNEWPVTATNLALFLDPNWPTRFYRIRATSLMARSAEEWPLDHVPGEVLAFLRPGGSAPSISARHRLTVREEIQLDALELHLVRYGIPEGRLWGNVLQELNKDPDVSNASRNLILKSQPAVQYSDRLWPQQHGFFQIHADQAHSLATGKGVRVAVIDSGLDLGHPEFIGRVRPEDCFDAVRANHTFSDLNNGHGTHVAGIIAAAANNGEGIVGVAPDAELIIARSGGPSHAVANVLKCLDFAAARGARVINMSLGMASDTPDANLDAKVFEQVTIDALVAKGITVIASAMNDQMQGSPFALPGCLPNVIAVGAVDAQGKIASFSNLRPYVDVVAPGVEILSCYPRILGDRSGYEVADGTSMAAPFVTGIVALMLEANPNLSPCETQAILEKTALELGTPGKDALYGSGLVDAFAAVTAAQELQNQPDLLNSSCDLVVLSEENQADVQGIRINWTTTNVTARALNPSRVPWGIATAGIADAAGNLYITAKGGLGPGVYRLASDGKMNALAIGAPFESPEGIALDREGNILVVDRASRRILRIDPHGDVAILHQGNPLSDPTGIDYTDYRSVFVISEASSPGHPEAGGIYQFELANRVFELLLSNAFDFEDVTSYVPGNLLYLATAPLGATSGAEFVLATHYQPRQPQQVPIDLGGFSTEGWKGVCRDLQGNYWFADNDAPTGGVVELYQKDRQLLVRALNLKTIPKPVDVVSLPPGKKTMAPPELIYLASDHVFLDQVGTQDTLSVVGKLSDDRLISLEEERQAGRISFISALEEIARVDGKGVVTAVNFGVCPIVVHYHNLETIVLAVVGATGLKIYHPETPVSPAGYGDFAVPHGSTALQVRVAMVFQNSRVIALEEVLARNVYTTDNPLSVSVGVGAAAGWLTFQAAGVSRLTVRQGPLTTSIRITVQGSDPVSLAGIAAQQKTLTLRVGQEVTLAIDSLFSNGERGPYDNRLGGFEFQSSAPLVAVVGQHNGTVLGISPGTATILVVNGSFTDTVQVMVTPANQPPHGTIISPASDVTRYVGAGIPFRGEALDPDGEILQSYWSFAGALPNRGGTETGPIGFQNPGIYEVTFFVCDNEYATDPNPDRRQITILPRDVILVALDIIEPDLKLAIGEEQPLTVVGHYNDGSVHPLSASMSQTRYASANTSVARVSADGMVHAYKAGETLITATNGGCSDTVRVTVEAEAAQLTAIDIVGEDLFFVAANTTVQLQVLGQYTDASQRDLTAAATGTSYTSSHPEVASVSPEGLVTAHADGSTVLSANHSGFSDAIRATVTLPANPRPTVTMQIVKQTIQQGEQTYLYWQSSNATHVVIQPEIGTGIPVGMVPIMPAKTTTYTVTAYGLGNTEPVSKTVEVIPTPQLGFEKLAGIGGWLSAVAVSGNTAYLGQGDTFVTLDIHDPASPLFVGRLALGHWIKGVKVSGDQAYVGTTAGFHILEVSDPANPRLLGRVAGEAVASDMSGSLACVASGLTYGVQFIEVSDPANPLPVGHYAEEYWSASDIAVAGSIACVTGGFLRPTTKKPGLWLIDFSNPAQPRLVGKVNTETATIGVALSGHRAYFVTEFGELHSVDISTTGSTDSFGGPTSLLSQVYDLAIRGDQAYIAHQGGMAAVNLNGSAGPVSLDPSLGRLGAHGIAVAGSYAYVASYYGGLHVLDLASSPSPTPLGLYPTIADPQRVATASNHVFVADRYCGLFVFAGADPAHPVPTVFWNSTNLDIAGMDLALSDSYAYLAAGGQGLQILNIANPKLPIRTGSFNNVLLGSVNGVVASEGLVYLSSNGRDVLAVDVSHPDTPVQIARAQTAGWDFGLDMYADRLYVSKGTSGFSLIDISNPKLPVEASSLGGLACSAVAAFGQYALLTSTGTNVLRIVQAADLTSPTIISSFAYGNNTASDIAFANGYAFLACQSDGLVVVDVIDPWNPTYAGQYADGLSYTSVHVEGNIVYLGSSVGGISLLRTQYGSGNVTMPVAGKVRVTYLNREAKFTNEIWLDSPRSEFIFSSAEANLGSMFELGPFPADTVLGFALKNPEGWTFYTDYTRNTDAQTVHVLIKSLGSSAWRMSWEDSSRVADRDFDDVVMEVRIVQ